MRNLVIALGAALSLAAAPAALACSGSKVAEAAPAAKTADTANLQMASFTVDGMSCAVSCPVQIKTALAGIEGVSEVAVNFESKQVDVKYADGEVTMAQMKEAITKLGYKAQAVEAKAKAKASAET